MKGYFLPLSLSLSLEHTVFSCLLNVYVVKVMIGDGDDACFCMDYFPNIIIGLVRSGPYLGGATRMVCEMQPVLQPWWIGQNSATTIINLRSYNPHEGVDSEKKEQLACNLHTFSSNSNTKPNFLSVLFIMPTMAAEKSDVLLAEQIKQAANEAFKANKFSQAIDLYTKAIELNGQNYVYWANRAFSHTKLEEYGSAIQDASRAIDIDPKYSKGYSRRGAAYLSMGKFKDALKDFQK
ncbi:putative protein-serine/threonine phosphatase [Helianthus annuus]|nr:putative protein-serine/threonine phosphatase [Helianthus annuus]KAJ0491501.1 putative protein-serine/threonine phosphatase [Helianthus annuus]